MNRRDTWLISFAHQLGYLTSAQMQTMLKFKISLEEEKVLNASEIYAIRVMFIYDILLQKARDAGHLSPIQYQQTLKRVVAVLSQNPDSLLTLVPLASHLISCEFLEMSIETLVSEEVFGPDDGPILDAILSSSHHGMQVAAMDLPPDAIADAIPMPTPPSPSAAETIPIPVAVQPPPPPVEPKPAQKTAIQTEDLSESLIAMVADSAKKPTATPPQPKPQAHKNGLDKKTSQNPLQRPTQPTREFAQQPATAKPAALNDSDLIAKAWAENGENLPETSSDLPVHKPSGPPEHEIAPGSQNFSTKDLLSFLSSSLISKLEKESQSAAQQPPPAPPVPPEAIEGTESQQVALEFHEIGLSAAMPENIPLHQLGQYEILQEIGAGGMGKVYKAFHPRLERIVAIKVMTPGRAGSDRDHSRFLAEAKMTAKLQHPNIVAIHEVGSAEGIDFLVMDLIEGVSLASLMVEQQQNRSKLTTRRALEIIRDVALAMEYAHELGIIHRDLKPENIMIEKNAQRPMVMDFGLAKNMQMAAAITKDGEILGTPRYMAPEQASGQNDRICPATDVYSLGAILYEIVTGQPAVEGTHVMNILYNISHQEIILPRQHNPHIAPDLEAILLKTLAKEPAMRYESSKELAEDISRFLNGEAIVARRFTWSYWCLKKIYRYRVPITAILAAAVISTAALIWSGREVQEKFSQEKKKTLQEIHSHSELWWKEYRDAVQSDVALLQNLEERWLQARSLLTERQQLGTTPQERLFSKLLEQDLQPVREPEPGTATVDPTTALPQKRLITLWFQYRESLLQHRGQKGREEEILQRYQRLAQTYEEIQSRYARWQSKYQEQEVAAALPGHPDFAHPVLLWLKDNWPENYQTSAISNPARWIEQAIFEKLQKVARAIQEKSGVVAGLDDDAQWEMSRWLHGYLAILSSQNLAVLDIHNKLTANIAARYNDILELIFQGQAKAEEELPGKGHNRDAALDTALEELYQICLQDAVFAPAYYQIARIYHLSGKNERLFAGRYYEVASEIYRCEDALRQQFKFPKTSLTLSQHAETLYYLCELYAQKSTKNAEHYAKITDNYRMLREIANNSRILLPRERETVAVFYQMATFYTLAMDREKESRAWRELNSPYHFRFCPKRYTPGHQVLEPEYHKGIALYKQLLQLLDDVEKQYTAVQKMPSVQANIAYLQGLLYSDLLLTRETGVTDKPYLALAIESLEQAARHPLYREAWRYLGKLHYLVGNFTRAREAYHHWLRLFLDPASRTNYPLNPTDFLEYSLCLAYEKKPEQMNREIMDYLVAWRNLPAEFREAHQGDIGWVFAMLAMSYVRSQKIEPLRELVQEWEKYQNLDDANQNELWIYLMMKLKLGDEEKVTALLKQYWQSRISPQNRATTVAALTLLARYYPFLRHYEDPFCAPPQLRKLPEDYHKLFRQILEAQENQTHFVSRVADNTNYHMYAYFIDFAEEDKTLASQMAQVSKKIAQLDIAPLLVFAIHNKTGIDNAENRLLAAKTLLDNFHNASLYYQRAGYYFRQANDSKASEEQIAFLQKSLEDLQKALIDDNDGESKYHYATALLYASLAAKGLEADRYRQKSLFHLRLAIQLGWKQVEFTQKDSVFQIWKEDKEFKKLLAGPVRPFVNFSWDEITASAKELEKQGKLEEAQAVTRAFLAIMKRVERK